MGESNRTYRMADLIHKNLSVILRLELRDPRISLVTISEVKVSANLNHSDIYVTFMDVDNDHHKTFKEEIHILNKAAGYLRTRLSKAIYSRFVPALRFHYDHSIAHGQYITTLINDASKN